MPSDNPVYKILKSKKELESFVETNVNELNKLGRENQLIQIIINKKILNFFICSLRSKRLKSNQHCVSPQQVSTT